MNKNEIRKPLTLMREDFLKNLVDLINKSQLPFFVIESVLKESVSEVHMLCQQELETDRKNYEAQIESSNNEKSAAKESEV